MTELVLGGGLAAAFLAGIVALFAPCCITVLFPSYLAAAVRNRRWRLLPLTAVFAAGLAVVLLPVTLGVGMLTEGLLRFHGLVYAGAGVALLAFAGVVALGMSWTLPLLRSAPDVSRTDSGGVFTLGVFSGAASACCAPVLAGVLTLSAVAPGLGWSTALGAAYVFGMVSPLVLMTALWDRLGRRDLGWLHGRSVSYRIAGREVRTTGIDLVVAGTMALMGLGLLVVAATGATLAPDAQTGLGIWAADLAEQAAGWLAPLPDAVVGVLLIALAAGAVALAGRRRAPVDATVSTHDPEPLTSETRTAETTRPGTPRSTDDRPSTRSDRSCHDPHP